MSPTSAPYFTSRRSVPLCGNGQTPEHLKNRVPEYHMAKRIWSEYEKELELWLKNRWLVLYPEKEPGPAKALILLMVVVKVNKNKVRPVMEYRELNGSVDAFTANTKVTGMAA